MVSLNISKLFHPAVAVGYSVLTTYQTKCRVGTTCQAGVVQCHGKKCHSSWRTKKRGFPTSSHPRSTHKLLMHTAKLILCWATMGTEMDDWFSGDKRSGYCKDVNALLNSGCYRQMLLYMNNQWTKPVSIKEAGLDVPESPPVCTMPFCEWQALLAAIYASVTWRWGLATCVYAYTHKQMLTRQASLMRVELSSEQVLSCTDWDLTEDGNF